MDRKGRTPGPDSSGGLLSAPPPEAWDDWVEFDPKAWPQRVERRYHLIPTVCFNCEAACGLLAYVDKETGEVRKMEGHPMHPASRGRNCAKGPATVAQMTNPDRLLYPLRRRGPRGFGRWERISWDEALDDIAARIRRAILERRLDEVVYHVGRPGEDLFTERVLAAWGVDGHNSHTNVCSSGGRAGYAFWMGFDRPAPDHGEARFILLFSAHMESGHYFNPHAQRLVEARERGAKIAVVDPRLSHTAARADYWLSPHPGTEAGLLLAIAARLIAEGAVNTEFVRRWVNWREALGAGKTWEALRASGFISREPAGTTFADFMRLLEELYAPYTPEWAEEETGVPAATIVRIAEEIARAGTAWTHHIWRGAAAGHLGGWMITRCLVLLAVLTGAVGTKGGTLPNAYAKFVPRPPTMPDPIRAWNELHWPREYPLAHMEMSFLLPHLMKERRDKKIDVYFTRVYNPVWTNPDGFMWIDLLRSEEQIGLHVALTPVWCETAQYADYVLPMGLGPERHDLHSYETHAARWIGFRQPVLRVFRESRGEEVALTRHANPGEVWEENELWIELSWRIDPDGSLGIRRHFESPYRPGEKVTVAEYYRWIFEHSVPGLPEAARKAGLDPLAYMRKRGAFEITRDVYAEYERPVLGEPDEIVSDGEFGWYVQRPVPENLRPTPGPFQDEAGRWRAGIVRDGRVRQGFPTPSGLLEFYSATLAEWGWPEAAVPVYPRTDEQRRAMGYLVSQVHWARLDRGAGELVLLPNFRLPTLIHTRTNGAKWLYEISHVNPVWMHPRDAEPLGLRTDDLVRVDTPLGYFVDRVWVTEAIRPGAVACSHHLGRWRLHNDHGSDRWNSAVVAIEEDGGRRVMRPVRGVEGWKSDDRDSERIWWHEAGVNQNLLFPVQPDPVSGMHCWAQKVRVRKAQGGEAYGDVVVNTERSMEVFKQWLTMAKPAPGPGGRRRPRWLLRPLKPRPEAYRMPEGEG